MKKIYLIVLLFMFLSCEKKETKNVESNLQTEVNQKDTLEANTQSPKDIKVFNNWKDELISDYVKNSKKELIKVHFKAKDQLEWFLDRTQKKRFYTILYLQYRY